MKIINRIKMNWKLSEIQNANKVSQYYDGLYHAQTMNQLYERDLVNLIKTAVPEGAKILDLGCGTGTLSRALSKYYVVIGIDISHEMLLYTNSPAIQADGEHMPFKDGYFNAVVCSQTLHHYPDLKNVLNEVHRVLDRKGKVIISEPNQGFRVIYKAISPVLYLLTGTMKRMGFDVYEYDYVHDEVTEHHRALSEKELVNGLSDFKIIELSSNYFISPYFVNFKNKKLCLATLYIDSIIKYLLPRTGRDILIVCRHKNRKKELYEMTCDFLAERVFFK